VSSIGKINLLRRTEEVLIHNKAVKHGSTKPGCCPRPSLEPFIDAYLAKSPSGDTGRKQT